MIAPSGRLRTGSVSGLVPTGFVVLIMLGTMAGIVPAADPEAAKDLRFTRVHVPRASLVDVPLGEERYVPMPRDAFEAAVARSTRSAASASPVAVTRADAARYEAVVTPAGRIEGRVAFDVSVAETGKVPGEMSLGGLSVSRCTSRTDAGVGAAVVFTRPDGTPAVVTAGAGEYEADFSTAVPLRTVDGPLHTLPLVPALRASIRLQLPPGFRPLLVGHELVPVRDGVGWRIEAGNRTTLDFYVIEDRRQPPAIATWSTIDIAGREVAVAACVVPATVWNGAEVVIEKDPALEIAEAVLADPDPRSVSWAEARDGRSLTCVLPARALGTRTPFEIRAVGPLPVGGARPLPTLGPPADRWAGGGAVLSVDPTLALASIDLERCLAVTAEAAAAWVLPGGSRAPADEASPVPGVRARVFLEQQGPAAHVRAVVMPRAPRVEVMRVTVVDFAPGAVTGVATCDIGVRRGEAFDLTAAVAPGWFIDSVDAVGWSPALEGGETGAVLDVRTAEPLEWKVVRDGRGDSLRIGLAAAATPGRRLRLRISGHRAGAAAGAAFSSGEIDMVRLDGETDGRVAIGFKTSAEQAVEIEGPAGVAVDPRLAPLVDDPGVRAWAPAGGRAAAWQVSVVRRRPPLDVHAQVRLTVRDDRLSQSFSIECRPDTSDLDAIVVRFSEPMEEQLEWTLLAPAGGALVARRLESAEDSWLVEFTPPVREAVTVRAVRTVPFRTPLPVPLVWVEGAARQVGEVIVRDAGRRRPRIVNRRLTELPPRFDDPDQWPSAIAEFSYAGESVHASTPPAAELVPGTRDDAAARAWAWRETMSCWCHASGRTEFDSVFDIESHGRTAVMLGIPPGRQLQGVEIDGVPIAVGIGSDTASVPIELPAGRPLFRLVVRTVADPAPPAAWWSIEPAGVAIDLPVLDRLCRVAVPPELEVASFAPAWRALGHDGRGLVGRFFGAGVPAVDGAETASESAPGDAPDGAFRTRDFVPAAGHAAGGALLIVRRRWLDLAALAIAGVAAAAAVVGSRSRPWLPPLVCVVAGVAVMWSPAPEDLIARAAWWAGIGAALLAATRRTAALAPIALALTCVAVGGELRAEDALRVLITPAVDDEQDGEMALVPEPLYRVLANSMADDVASVRVVACRVTVPAGGPVGQGDERWRLSIEIDAEAAGVLALTPQEDAQGWLSESLRIDGRPARLASGQSRHDVLIPAAGRHRVDVEVRPHADRAGTVEMLTAAIPPAPTATLEVEAAAGREGSAAGLHCEAALAGEPFASAAGAWSAPRGRFVHDVSRAARVRLVRTQIEGVAIAADPPVVASRNTVYWDLDGCRVEATFAIDAGRDIAPSCIVRADRGLGLVGPVDPALIVLPLPGNRFLVRPTAPSAGVFRFEIAFRMALADPVGIFPVPQAWIADAVTDVRTTTLIPAGDLVVQVDAPASLTMLAANDTPAGAFAWRFEARPRIGTVAGVGEEFVAVPGEDRARIAVERRRQDIRGRQDVRVRFAQDRAGVVLDARLDASSTPLVTLPLELPTDCIIDSAELFDDGLQTPDASAHGPIESHWRQVSPDRGVLTVQRPRAGRFRLEVAGHLRKPPAPTGRVPVVRALLPAAPVVVTWNETMTGEDPNRSWELRTDERPPLYSLRRAREPEDAAAEDVGGSATSEESPGSVEPRVELAEMDVMFEDRGRAWGRARFDVVTQDRLLRLALPRGMRLFEVFVDGQPTAPAMPASPAPVGAGERWDIRLHDASWPRSLEVVYAGDVGQTLGDDGPIQIEAPTLVGLPCVRRLWTLRAPRDAVVHVAEPGRRIDGSSLREDRRAALAAISLDFERAIAAAAPAERERLREGLEARRRLAEADTGADAAASGSVVHVGAGIDVPLTIRIARQRDPTVFGRAWATLVILAIGGASGLAARRRMPSQTPPSADVAAAGPVNAS